MKKITFIIVVIILTNCFIGCTKSTDQFKVSKPSGASITKKPFIPIWIDSAATANTR